MVKFEKRFRQHWLFVDLPSPDEFLEEFKRRFGLGYYSFDVEAFTSKDRVLAIADKLAGERWMHNIERWHRVRYKETTLEELRLSKVLPYCYNMKLINEVNDMISKFGFKASYMFPNKPAPLFIFADNYSVTIAPIMEEAESE